MCGIAGIFSFGNDQVPAERIGDMLQQIRYRGPDDSGIYTGDRIGMGSVRLSIIDIENGNQPMSTPEKELWIVFNGEIFNYIELRKELEEEGYRFRTKSDTEVLLLLYKHMGRSCLNRLNGQFAFAIWDTVKRELFLARDRVGIRPLFYFNNEGRFIFGSEIKCIAQSGWYSSSLSLEGLGQVLTFWNAHSPRTMFRDVFELPPGHYMILSEREQTIKSYWELSFSDGGDLAAGSQTSGNLPQVSSPEEYMEAFEALLKDSVRLRLRADVQVAAYLSGGLDSSATTYYIKKIEPGVLNTFSVGFEEDEFDESHYQRMVSGELKTAHEAFTCRNQDIAEHFPRVLWHAETPLLRTGAVPMYMLSKQVHEKGIKVVITGEGADEFLGGYNIFKEALIREFWAKDPESSLRPLLFQRLYPYLEQFKGRNKQVLKLFFGQGLTETGSPVYSHRVRWHNSMQIKNYLDPQVAEAAGDPIEEFVETLPGNFSSWDLLSRAQWIESRMFLSGYLLSSQGDRVSMANSVEGRYPFLDHRLVEFCSRLPSALKIRGLREKYLLKKLMKDKLPGPVVSRYKQAYRAPVSSGLFHGEIPGYFRDRLSESQLKATGIFNSESVQKLVSKLEKNSVASENENMALAGILSTQIFSDLFISGNNSYRQKDSGTSSFKYYS